MAFAASLSLVACTILLAGDIPLFTVSPPPLDEDLPIVLSLAAELVLNVLRALLLIELAEEWTLALSRADDEVPPPPVRLDAARLRLSTLTRMLLAASLSASIREVWGWLEIRFVGCLLRGEPRVGAVVRLSRSSMGTSI